MSVACVADRWYCEPEAICKPREFLCDGHKDCANGIDEQGCDFIIGCLNDGVRVDGNINTCDCGVRYAGERCETDLGGCCEVAFFYTYPVH